MGLVSIDAGLNLLSHYRLDVEAFNGSLFMFLYNDMTISILTEISDLGSNEHITVTNLTGTVSENLLSNSTISNEDFALTVFDLTIAPLEAVVPSSI